MTTTKENEMTTTTTDHIEAAADALRQHLHDRPWVGEPERIYHGIADLQNVAWRSADIAKRCADIARTADRSDDGNDERARLAAEALGRAFDLLRQAADELGAAQCEAGHLIWRVPTFAA